MSDQNAIDHLDEVYQESNLRIRQSISSGFNIWKQSAGSFIAYIVVVIIISFILALIPGLGQIANNVLVSPALGLGAYLYANKLDTGAPVEFGDFLNGFKFSGTIIVARILITIVMFLLAMLLFRNMFGGNWLSVLTGESQTLTNSITEAMLDEDFDLSDYVNFTWMTLVYLIPLILFSFLIFYTECFIGFYNLSAMDAIKYSAQFVLKNLPKLIILTILIGIIAMSGIIGIFIGIIITISMIFPMFYKSFAIMTRLDEFENGGDLDDHLEDVLIGE